MVIKEKVKKVMDMESYTDRNGELRQSRDLILETEEQYPKEIALNIGDTVEVTFDIRSVPSKTTGRYFTSLNAWRLNIIQSIVNDPTQAPAAPVTVDGNVIKPQ